METDTKSLPHLDRGDGLLINALDELSRCGGYNPSHRERKEESGEVKHAVKVRI